MITDERAKKLANIVLEYSISIKPDDAVLIQAEHPFEEFAKLIGKLANEKGAGVVYDIWNLKGKKELIERSDDSELEAESKRMKSIAESVTARVRIDADSDPYYLKNVAPEKIAKHFDVVMKPFYDRIIGNGKEFKGVKWNLVAFPCESDAKEAGMTMEEYSDFVYNATLIDWPKMGEQMKQIKDLFDNVKDVHICVPGKTDLHLSLEGRGGQVSDGRHNMPSGEVFYGPVEDSANGNICFPYPSVRDGNQVSGIRLEFKNGEVVSFDVKENRPFFETMLALDGVKRIGELGIGCNYGITNYIKNLLFDEKIGGTVHTALGESYLSYTLDNGGGLNEGKIHWDLVCDLRKIDGNPGGKIYINDKLVQENGIWVFK